MSMLYAVLFTVLCFNYFVQVLINFQNDFEAEEM